MDWYILYTTPGKEDEAAELVRNKISPRFWHFCRVPKKQQLFRIHGKYVLNKKVLFLGYVFVATNTPELLQKELWKSHQFPQLFGERINGIAKVEPKDLEFLCNICGTNLEKDMGLSLVQTDKDGKIVQANGALKPYQDKIIRQRLRQRYVIAEISLFNRKEEVLFGVKVDGNVVGG